MKFSIIYCDPAWSYDDKALAGDRGAVCKYVLMTDAEMQALPVQDIAAEDSVCFMWVTYPKLQEGLDLLRSWGFTYKTVAFTWVKPTGTFAALLAWLNTYESKASRVAQAPSLLKLVTAINTLWFIGMGRWTRSNAEIVLLGVRGKPVRVDAGVNQVICAPCMRHSAKPPETRDRIARLMGTDCSRVELFARDAADGWVALGFDIDGQDLRQSIPELAAM